MDRSLVFEASLYARAKTFIERCTAAKHHVGVAESCTGGLLAALLTEVPGAAEVFDLGVVSYAYSAKEQILGVPHETLEHVGAVSEPVARAMVDGIFSHSGVDLAAGITGIAGPTGGGEEKPIGTVWIAAGRRGQPVTARRFQFGNVGRSQVRLQSVAAALEMLEQLL